MADFKALLAGAKLPEKTVHICLRGDLTAEVERLDKELEHLQKRGRTSLADDGGASLEAQIGLLQEKMREHTYPVRMRSLTRSAWRELALAHPPRVVDGETPLEDLKSGVNYEAHQEPLVRASIIDPDMDDETFRGFVDALTDRQYAQLVDAAWELNRGTVDVPFSPAALRARRITSDE